MFQVTLVEWLTRGPAISLGRAFGRVGSNPAGDENFWLFDLPSQGFMENGLSVQEDRFSSAPCPSERLRMLFGANCSLQTGSQAPSKSCNWDER